MLAGFSPGSDILPVDYTGRLFRAGKAPISAELAGIFDRLATNGESWRIRLERLHTGRLFRRFIPFTPNALNKVARRLCAPRNRRWIARHPALGRLFPQAIRDALIDHRPI
jgi:hypothetical protein